METNRITVKVSTRCGDGWTTDFNGTIEEARSYFIGQQFNLGVEGDRLVVASDVCEVSQ